MLKILLTGANGFVGKSLGEQLVSHNYTVVPIVRRKSPCKKSRVIDITPETDWSPFLINVYAVIHLAARVHIMDDESRDPLSDFRYINTAATISLAKQAARNGVKRFIYLSSIKVNGELSLDGSSFTAEDVFIPDDPYALSKYEAEQKLLQLAQETPMEVVIIRPPLVYGPNVKANFLSMMKWVDKGVPLPFGNIHNKRSLVALDNLIDFILKCIEHPNATNQIFLVSDGEDLSLTELLNRISWSLGKKLWLIPVNQRIVESFLRIIGKKDLIQRLCGSLQVDISKTKELLNWAPPVDVNEALAKTVKHFLERKY